MTGLLRAGAPGRLSYVQPMRTKLIPLFALLSLLAIGACGEGADDDAASNNTGEAASSDTLTTEEFIEEADTICGALDAAAETVQPPDSPEGMPVYLTELIAQAEEAHKQLSELSPPEDGKTVHQALLEALSTSIETRKGAITAYESGDSVTGGDLIVQADTEADAADQDAQAYGFTECGSEDDDAAAGEEEPADPDMIEE